MELENATPLLQFWLTAENFHSHLSSQGPNCNLETTVRDAIAIYDRYQDPLRLAIIVETI